MTPHPYHPIEPDNPFETLNKKQSTVVGSLVPMVRELGKRGERDEQTGAPLDNAS